MNQEKLLFVLPSSMEAAAVAMDVLSHYLITRMVTGRDSRNVVVVCPLKEMHRFVKASWVFVEVVEEPTEQQLEEAEVTFEFSIERSYKMTKGVQKSMADSFAIQLGVGLLRTLPPILVEDTFEEKGKVLVADRAIKDGRDASWVWPHKEAFIELLDGNDIPCTILNETASWDETRLAVGRASVVVGVRGTATLMASAASKLVIELEQSSQAHREWLRKTKKMNYRMAYGRLEDMTADFIWKNVEALVRQNLGRKETVLEEAKCMTQD